VGLENAVQDPGRLGIEGLGIGAVVGIDGEVEFNDGYAEEAEDLVVLGLLVLEDFFRDTNMDLVLGEFLVEVVEVVVVKALDQVILADALEGVEWSVDLDLAEELGVGIGKILALVAVAVHVVLGVGAGDGFPEDKNQLEVRRVHVDPVDGVPAIAVQRRLFPHACLFVPVGEQGLVGRQVIRKDTGPGLLKEKARLVGQHKDIRVLVHVAREGAGSSFLDADAQEIWFPAHPLKKFL